MKGLTPLLDTLFILLFALLALSETRTSTRQDLVWIQLPMVEPSVQAPREASRKLVLFMDASSRVHLGETGLEIRDRAELDRALGQALGEALPEEVTVEIQGDRNARAGVAVELLQHLRLRGFSQVSLVASGTSGPGELFGEDR